jgi:hypothetical protein
MFHVISQMSEDFTDTESTAAALCSGLCLRFDLPAGALVLPADSNGEAFTPRDALAPVLGLEVLFPEEGRAAKVEEGSKGLAAIGVEEFFKSCASCFNDLFMGTPIPAEDGACSAPAVVVGTRGLEVSPRATEIEEALSNLAESTDALASGVVNEDLIPEIAVGAISTDTTPVIAGIEPDPEVGVTLTRELRSEGPEGPLDDTGPKPLASLMLLIGELTLCGPVKEGNEVSFTTREEEWAESSGLDNTCTIEGVKVPTIG